MYHVRTQVQRGQGRRWCARGLPACWCVFRFIQLRLGIVDPQKGSWAHNRPNSAPPIIWGGLHAHSPRHTSPLHGTLFWPFSTGKKLERMEPHAAGAAGRRQLYGERYGDCPSLHLFPCACLSLAMPPPPPPYPALCRPILRRQPPMPHAPLWPCTAHLPFPFNQRVHALVRRILPSLPLLHIRLVKGCGERLAEGPVLQELIPDLK